MSLYFLPGMMIARSDNDEDEDDGDGGLRTAEIMGFVVTPGVEMSGIIVQCCAEECMEQRA